ncbi:hypothetical protein Dcar01_02057 [Deinococcus carri]|uniref:DUF3995 domain-containing protein n=1 Tax=Deinococcus carri TaxID=1211323 RepID=A0ABP9W7K2_9DEIO
MTRTVRTTPFVWIACLLGLIHAAFSLYWAGGGRWLLNTVGQWAVELGQQAPRQAFWLLLLIALFKAAAAIIPLLNTRGRLPWPRLWRGISWVGGIFLILYGGANTLTAWAVLAGVIRTESFDRASLAGHAALWDPLFFLWGLFLTLHLFQTRRGNASSRSLFDQN